jgi:D-glycero-alpha-D-manno-heptose-7-phosphate kinase
MIMTRTPFRISFAGGGSDLPGFYRRAPGAVVSVTIDKYMYVMLRENFTRDQILLKYSRSEMVTAPAAILHPIFRQVLSDYALTGLEIALSADVPAGTGLASSSALTVGLHQSVGIYLGRFLTKERLARLACETEISKLGRPIGKQDQYAAAYGGLNFIEFHPDERVTVESLQINGAKRERLEAALVLVHAGRAAHSAEVLLRGVTAALHDERKFQQMTQMVALAHDLRREIVSTCDPRVVGEILHEGWRRKRALASGVTTDGIDAAYELGLKHGALGGKLLGAGGAGFLLFVCSSGERERLLRGLEQFQNLPFRFESQGAAVVYVSEDATRRAPARGRAEDELMLDPA